MIVVSFVFSQHSRCIYARSSQTVQSTNVHIPTCHQVVSTISNDHPLSKQLIDAGFAIPTGSSLTGAFCLNKTNAAIPKRIITRSQIVFFMVFYVKVIKLFSRGTQPPLRFSS